MAQKKNVRYANRKHTFRNVLSLILLILAIGLLFYPIVANYLAGQQSVQTVQKYNQELKKSGPSKLNQMYDDARLYNARLYNE